MITSLDLQPFFPSELVIQDVKTVSNTVYIEMKSKTTTIRCPKCGKEISKYHAVHKRTVQDLPILGNRTFLKLSLYEFDCDNQDCPCVSVTENFDGFLNGYSRMTERLADFITELALETSCEGAARILQSMNIKISGDTVIRTLLKRFENQDIPSCGSSVRVDDFAFKKRHKYGTIIVDEDTHNPIAVLDGRDGTTLKEWLKKNQHVTTVTRDRASAYAKAIEEILPDAMQIADRFHLHQNLLDAVNKVLGREIPATTAVPIKAEDLSSSQKAINAKQAAQVKVGKKNAYCCG